MWKNYPARGMGNILSLKKGDKIDIIVKSKYSRETGELVNRVAVM